MMNEERVRVAMANKKQSTQAVLDAALLFAHGHPTKQAQLLGDLEMASRAYYVAVVTYQEVVREQLEMDGGYE